MKDLAYDNNISCKINLPWRYQTPRMLHDERQKSFLHSCIFLPQYFPRTQSADSWVFPVESQFLEVILSDTISKTVCYLPGIHHFGTTPLKGGRFVLVKDGSKNILLLDWNTAIKHWPIMTASTDMISKTSDGPALERFWNHSPMPEDHSTWTPWYASVRWASLQRTVTNTWCSTFHPTASIRCKKVSVSGWMHSCIKRRLIQMKNPLCSSWRIRYWYSGKGRIHQ